MKVIFYASGYGTKKYNFKNRDELMEDVDVTAAEYNGTIQDNGDELIVIDESGEEVARWQVI